MMKNSGMGMRVKGADHANRLGEAPAEPNVGTCSPAPRNVEDSAPSSPRFTATIQRELRPTAVFRSQALLLALVAAALITTGCHRDSDTIASLPPELPAVEASLVEAVVEADSGVESVVGEVRAKTLAQISAKVPGRIVSLNARIGQRVKQGELLARLDAAEIDARLEQAEASLAQADKELKRYQGLLSQNAVTQAEFDAVQSAQRIAAAAVKEARAMREYTKVVAPFDGAVARKLAEVGDIATPGRPLLELEGEEGLQFVADIPEALASRLTLGDELSALPENADQALTVAISEIAPSANPLSRTLQVKLDLPDSPLLRAGQFGRVSVPVKGVANVRVPAAAVVRRGQLEMVFVSEGGKARMRLVRVGKTLGDQVEILSGVEAGEQIVIADQVAALRDGQPINVQ